MMYTMMHGKIHRATVTEANLEYMGSITIDEDLMDAAGTLFPKNWKPTALKKNM